MAPVRTCAEWRAGHPVGVSLCLLVMFGASSLAAQQVTGAVVDALTSRPVAGVQVRLLDAAETTVASALANAEGRFVLSVAEGTYALVAEWFGYRPYRLPRVSVARDGTDAGIIRLEPVPIPVEGVFGVIRRKRVEQEASYEGFYARGALSPPVGSNRVLLHTSPEFAAASSVRDLLRNFRPAGTRLFSEAQQRSNARSPAESGCHPIVLWNGFPVGGGLANEYLTVPTSGLEGVEYYRDMATLPLALRSEVDRLGVPNPMESIRNCGVLVLWPRRPGG